MKNLKLLKNRKAQNDSSILFILLMIFVALAVTLPSIYSGYGSSVSNNDVDGLSNEVGDSIGGVSTLSVIGGIFFWSFGIFPFWLDGFLLVLKIMIGWLIYRNLPVIGGGG